MALIKYHAIYLNTEYEIINMHWQQVEISLSTIIVGIDKENMPVQTTLQLQY